MPWQQRPRQRIAKLLRSNPRITSAGPESELGLGELIAAPYDECR